MIVIAKAPLSFRESRIESSISAGCLRPFLEHLREMAVIMHRLALDDQFPWLQRLGVVASRGTLSPVP